MIFFKKIPVEELANPNKQLQKVLAFKESICSTDFYKEFESERNLEELVQDALHDWILKNRNEFETPSETSSIVTLQPDDIEVLACIVEKGQFSLEEMCISLEKSSTATEASIQRLQNLGLIVKESHGVLKLINSTDGFLAISKHLNTDVYYKILLSSFKICFVLHSKPTY